MHMFSITSSVDVSVEYNTQEIQIKNIQTGNYYKNIQHKDQMMKL